MLMDFSVIVPLYNEVDNVAPLTRDILSALSQSNRSLEILLVDDHSSDGTWEKIGQLRQQDSRIRGLRHQVNKGQSAALLTGFRHAKGAIICTLDGDCQNDPADFPRMVEALADCDLVCGVRAKRMDNFVRRASSRIARAARRWALQVDFKDTGCNLRVFRREILPLLPPFNGLHRFMPVLAHGGGARVKEVPVRHHPRASGVSKYGVWNRLGRGIADLVMIRLYMRRQLAPVPVVEVMPDGPPSRSAPPT
jgi:glycosyltransferase involved in cell wall biosynthesis